MLGSIAPDYDPDDLDFLTPLDAEDSVVPAAPESAEAEEAAGRERHAAAAATEESGHPTTVTARRLPAPLPRLLHPAAWWVWAVGLDFPVFWGLVAFILNFVPVGYFLTRSHNF